MATFQIRNKVIGAKRYTGDNAEEIAEFLSVGSKIKYQAEEIEESQPVGVWAVKDSGRVQWFTDELIREVYKLTVQGDDESYSDDYR